MLTWRRLRRDGVRPDLLVVEVLPAYFDSRLSGCDLNEKVYPETHLSWDDLDVIERYVADRRPQARRDWLRHLPADPYERRLDVINRLAPGLLPLAERTNFGRVVEEIPENPNDTAAWLSPERRREALDFARRQYAEGLSNFRLGGVNCDALRDLLTECRREGVPAALLLMPEGPTFRSWYAPGAIEQVRRWLDELYTEFGVGLIDAREWMDEDDFFDSHHLTRAGARRFTQRLGEVHLLPLLRALP
jgi:hypothetical protein